MSDSRKRRRAAPRPQKSFTNVRWIRRLQMQLQWRRDARAARQESYRTAASNVATGGFGSSSSQLAAAGFGETSGEEHVGLAAMAMPTLPRGGSRKLYGRMMVILAVVVASLFVALLGLSQVQNMRNQQVAFEGFRYELANGTAPVYAADQNSKLLAPGTPVALLKIPRIGVSAVVVEGTTSDITMLGPGHRRDTVLPGQEGVSVVYGRQFTYGSVFSQLSELKAGDKITVTTGQGESRFTVDGVRYDDDPLPDPPAPGEGRLTLVSATGGIPLVPTGIVRVDATMVDDAYLAPLTEFTYAALGAEEEAMKGDGRAWPLLALSLVALVVLVVVFSLLRRFWGRWQTWIVAVPVFVATGTFAATQIALLFPNVI